MLKKLGLRSVGRCNCIDVWLCFLPICIPSKSDGVKDIRGVIEGLIDDIDCLLGLGTEIDWSL